MAQIINTRSGKVLLADDNGKGFEALFDAGYTYDEATDCVSIESEVTEIGTSGKTYIYTEVTNHAVTDLAIETEMSYKEYKAKHSKCKTKKDSYNAATKTIVVYVGAYEM